MASSIRVETYSPNLAYNRPVSTTSDESASYSGDKAVDADGTTRWSSAYANNQSIIVDLGANYSVTRVRLAWESAYARDYQIQFSTNDSTWTTVREFWGKSSADADDQTGLTGTARYVKVYCINRATTYGFSLFEFEIYGTSLGETTASSTNASMTSPSLLDSAINKLVVFPNPVKEAFNVQIPAGWEGTVQATVFNSSGQLLLSENINKNVQTISLAGLPSGVYILQLTRGTQRITKKNPEKLSCHIELSEEVAGEIALSAEPGHVGNFVDAMLPGGQGSAAFLRRVVLIISMGLRSEKAFPQAPFTSSSLKDRIDRLYMEENRAALLMQLATVIMILISCMGLFGLALFFASRWTKEFGVRKVLGATVASVSLLLSREFLLLVVAALVITKVTVGFQSFRVASVNPVDVLRNE